MKLIKISIFQLRKVQQDKISLLDYLMHII